MDIIGSTQLKFSLNIALMKILITFPSIRISLDFLLISWATIVAHSRNYRYQLIMT